MFKLNSINIKAYFIENYLLCIYLLSLIVGAVIYIPQKSFAMTMCGGHSESIITQFFLFFFVILIVPFSSLFFSKIYSLSYDFLDTYNYWIIFLGIYSLVNKVSGESLDDFLDLAWQVTVVALCMRIAIKRRTIDIHNKLVWVFPLSIVIACLCSTSYFDFIAVLMLVPLISWSITRRYVGNTILWWHLAVCITAFILERNFRIDYLFIVPVILFIHALTLYFIHRKNK